MSSFLIFLLGSPFSILTPRIEAASHSSALSYSSSLEALPVPAVFMCSLLFSLEPAPGFGSLKLVPQDLLVPWQDQIHGAVPQIYHFQVFCLHSSQFSCNGSCLVACLGLSVQASFFSAYLRCLGDSSKNVSLNSLWTVVNANFIFPKLTSSPIICLTSPFGCLVGMSSSICPTRPNP